MSDGIKKVASGWLRRTARSSGALARFAAGSLLGGPGAGDAKALVASMGQMKGLLMKMGQTLSYMDLYLPDEVREVLAELQDTSLGMDPDAASAVVEAELGRPPTQVFAQWDPEPFAAASIGQVHRARLHDPDGRAVAVKIQYPGVREAIETDLLNAKVVGRMKAVIFRGMDMPGMEIELRDRLLEECDYVREAESGELFGQLFADNPDVIVPAPVRELCTERVLVAELQPGLRFADFQAAASPAARQAASEVIHDFSYVSIFQHGVFNADPHPGNYLFPDMEAGRPVVFLDFGCVKRFPPEMLQTWTDLCRAVFEQDRERFRERVIALGFAPNPRSYDFDAHWQMCVYLLRPWLASTPPFEWTHDYVRESFRWLIFDNPNKFKVNVPPDFVFANRLQWGLHSVLAALAPPPADWRTRFLDLLYAEGADRPAPFSV